MTIFRGLGGLPPDFGPSAVTIGNFDGVHFGHRQILRRVREIAAEHGWKPSVLTFDPHPTRIVAPSRTPPLLTSPERRALLMEEEGIAQVLILPFTNQLAQWTPEEFVQRLLVDAMAARAVLVGDNFRFGHKAAGNVRVLAELGCRLGFTTQVVPAISCRGRVVSSSAVRELVRSGNVSLAARLLLHAYGIEGMVVGGRGVGSKETVPTLNLATTAEVIPATGVYITCTRDLENGREWRSVTNIGYRPTFGASDLLTIETFLLDPLEGGAPVHIRVEFLRRVRAERKFDSPESLRARIRTDARVAQDYFRRARAWTRRECISC